MKSNRKSAPKKKANVKQKKPITNPRKTLEKKVAKRLKPEFPNNFHFPNQFFFAVDILIENILYR